MSEEKGIAVADKRFKFTLPVSGVEISMRYSTRADKAYSSVESEIKRVGELTSALSKDDIFEMAYFSRIIVTPKLTIDDLAAIAEKDLIAIRVADSKVNDLSKDEVEALVRDFAIALK